MAETLTERDSEPGRPLVDVLTVVLDYDALLGEPEGSPLVLDGQTRITVVRGNGPSTRLHEGRTLELADRWVSSLHAVLEPTADGYRLLDQGSRNGTYVGKERVTERVLGDGDLIEIGHTLLCYRRAEARFVEQLLEAREPLLLGPTRTRCPEVAELVRQLHEIAPTSEPVLVLGETGVGKEIVARAVHEWSGRPGELRAVDCGAVPESLFESTFFGHRRGAFTGAHEQRTGDIVLAHRGTLFLDEVANMGLSSQAKLLRTLELGKVTPLGASEPEEVDIRIVAATNRDVLTHPEGFRADLLNRLSGFIARVPPLRRRREDLGVLARHFLKDAGATQASIRPSAGRALFGSGFTGNARQLRAALRSALVLSGGSPIDMHHLSAFQQQEEDEAAEESSPATEASPPRRMQAPSPAEIEQVLDREGGNVSRAARAMSVHARQLYRWMERFQIDPERFRKK